MNYTDIINTDTINALINYASIVLFVIGLLTAVVNVMVEVVKRLVPKVPTDIVVFILSIALTLLALFVAAAVLDITVMWHYAVGAGILGIFVAYSAMGNFDKLKEIFERFTKKE